MKAAQELISITKDSLYKLEISSFLFSVHILYVGIKWTICFFVFNSYINNYVSSQRRVFSLPSFHSFISSTDNKHMLGARSLGLVKTPVDLSSKDKFELRSHTAEPDSKAFFGGRGGVMLSFPAALGFSSFCSGCVSCFVG